VGLFVQIEPKLKTRFLGSIWTNKPTNKKHYLNPSPSTTYVKRHTSKFIKSSKLLAFKKPPIIDFQDEIVETYVRPEGDEEGVEKKKGRRFTRWVFKRRLDVNQTAQFLEKLRPGARSSFFLRYNYAVKLVNIETGLKMVYFQQQKGSPWFQNLKKRKSG